MLLINNISTHEHFSKFSFHHLDINECLTSNGGCAQNCANTIGSFTCSCNSGYSLNTDNRTCAGKIMLINKISTHEHFSKLPFHYLDINECQTSNGGCAQNCANTIGSFICSCNSGYILNADSRTCDGKTTKLCLFVLASNDVKSTYVLQHKIPFT